MGGPIYCEVLTSEPLIPWGLSEVARVEEIPDQLDISLERRKKPCLQGNTEQERVIAQFNSPQLLEIFFLNKSH